MTTNVMHSIILPVYNAFEEVSLCLKSIENSLDLNNNSLVELIIIDDMSNKETRELLEDVAQKNKNISLYRHEKNLGFLLTVNEGMGYAKGEIITLLNSDTTIPQNFTERIRECFNSRKEIGVASPILASGNPFSIKMHQNLKPLDVDTMDCLVKNSHPQYPTIVFPDGACFSISRACLDAVGVFDPAYAMGYFEELDYCMRAQEAGFDTVYIDNMYVYHKTHASFGQEQKRKYMAKNRILFHDMWGEKYHTMHKRFPKLEHKKRIYLCFYSKIDYYYQISMLFVSKLIPFSSIRRKIRAKFQ